MSSSNFIVVGDRPLTVADVVRVSEGKAAVALSARPAFRKKVEASVAFLARLIKEDGVVYGVTTGFGESVTVAIPPALIGELSVHIMAYHGCGLGNVFSPEVSRAVVTARLVSLSQGYSGVRFELLERLTQLLAHDAMPVMPEEGSVGASGDLTPLSYLAAVLTGQRDVFFKGARQPTSKVYSELGLAPLTLTPKEGLAVMNGTAVMTGLACLALSRAEYLVELSSHITALVSLATRGNSEHFDDALFALKPHPGQRRVAALIRSDLPKATAKREGVRLQDRYSLRCAPHVIGVLADALPFFTQLVETELNSANDNPLIDGEAGQLMHGGHFYGGHIAFAMDSLKAAVASVADLLDRQLALLVDVKSNHGLSMNLTGAVGERQALNHGFKAVQIGASAWTAEALRLTMPAASFSRSTECHNQDKVSMGTIAARDALRVLELTEQVAAAGLLAAVQGVDLRLRHASGSEAVLGPALSAIKNQVRTTSAFVEEDRPLETDLRALLVRLRQREIGASKT